MLICSSASLELCPAQKMDTCIIACARWGGRREGTAPIYPRPRGNANGPSVPPTSLGPADTTEDEGRGCSLVNAGLGVCDLVEAGDLKPESVAPLALVHVVPEGQDHLQQLLEAAALQHCLGAGTDG